LHITVRPQDPDATALQKTMAQHYLHRFGADDTRPNSTRAGVYLLAAAELGDSNAQQMMLGGMEHGCLQETPSTSEDTSGCGFGWLDTQNE